MLWWELFLQHTSSQYIAHLNLHNVFRQLYLIKFLKNDEKSKRKKFVITSWYLKIRQDSQYLPHS